MFVAIRRAIAGALLLAVGVFAAPLTHAAEAMDVRLGRDVVPTFQSVRLKLDPDKRSYSGSVHVDLDVLNPTDTVRFHAEGQRLTRITLRQGGDSLVATRVTGEHGLQSLGLAQRAIQPDRARAIHAGELDIERHLALRKLVRELE